LFYEFRRYALFQLIVLGLAATAVVVIYLISGNPLASLAGFAVLALQGLRPWFGKWGGSKPVQDERDEAIQKQATVAGYVALWLALVAWGTTATLIFGERGSVPLVWVAPVVWVAWWLVTCVQSMTILILDSRGA
jgi:hypothetical protein